MYLVIVKNIVRTQKQTRRKCVLCVHFSLEAQNFLSSTKALKIENRKKVVVDFQEFFSEINRSCSHTRPPQLIIFPARCLQHFWPCGYYGSGYNGCGNAHQAYREAPHETFKRNHKNCWKFVKYLVQFSLHAALVLINFIMHIIVLLHMCIVSGEQNHFPAFTERCAALAQDSRNV